MITRLLEYPYYVMPRSSLSSLDSDSHCWQILIFIQSGDFLTGVAGISRAQYVDVFVAVDDFQG